MSLTASEQLVWYIALGEAKGGKYDYKNHGWIEEPKPEVVYAVLAELNK